jgi:hypothetical protein
VNQKLDGTLHKEKVKFYVCTVVDNTVNLKLMKLILSFSVYFKVFTYSRKNEHVSTFVGLI